MKTFPRWLIAVLLLGLAIACVVLWLLQQKPLNSPAGLPAGGDFTLQSADGPVSLQDFRGKVVLLYFGYTFCPDICPTSLAAVAEGMKLLKPAELEKLAVLFISVDPERDKLPQLKEYAAFFHPKVLGLTGQPAVLAEVAKRYGAFYARHNVDSAGGAYVIDHTAETYVIDPAGRLSGKIPHAAPPDLIVTTIRKCLSQP